MQGEAFTYKLPYSELGIKPELIWKLMGYETEDSVEEPVLNSIQETITMGPDICDIRGGY